MEVDGDDDHQVVEEVKKMNLNRSVLTTQQAQLKKPLPNHSFSNNNNNNTTEINIVVAHNQEKEVKVVAEEFSRNGNYELELVREMINSDPILQDCVDSFLRYYDDKQLNVKEKNTNGDIFGNRA